VGPNWRSGYSLERHPDAGWVKMANRDGDYRTDESSEGALTRSGRPSQLPTTTIESETGLNGITNGLVYRMRGYSASLGYYVWWWADFIDSGYSEYTGPGVPLTSVVVFSIIGST
jgi:hypothetical protein